MHNTQNIPIYTDNTAIAPGPFVFNQNKQFVLCPIANNGQQQPQLVAPGANPFNAAPWLDTYWQPGDPYSRRELFANPDQRRLATVTEYLP